MVTKFKVGDLVRFKPEKHDYVRQWKCPQQFIVANIHWRSNNDHVLHWGDPINCPGAFMSWVESAEGPW